MQVTDGAVVNAWRLSSQQLHPSTGREAQEIVGRLGGVQAQYPGWANWSIGLRLRDATADEVQRARAERRIVRTWAFRGTLHYLAASDVSWLISLLAPTLVKRNARRYRQLGLDEDTFAQSNHVIYNALEPGEPLVRAEIARSLESAGISTAGQRLPYLVQRAALEGLICQGIEREGEPTYVLLSQWIDPRAVSRPEDPLAALTKRYFASHGPAAFQDFSWWSGLTVATARQALDAAPPPVQVEVEGKLLWAGREPPSPLTPSMAYLLPPYDEYLLGYKDRSWALDPAYAKQVNAGGGMPRPTVVVNGEVVGTWKRTVQGSRVLVTLALFRSLAGAERAAVRDAARRYAAFHSLPVQIDLPDE